MSRIPIRIRVVIAAAVAIVGVAGVVFYVRSRPTVSLRTDFSVAGNCYGFSKDGLLVAAYEYLTDTYSVGAPATGQSIYDAKLGTVRLHLPSVSKAVSFSPDSAFIGAPGKGIYDSRSGQLVLPRAADGYLFSPDSHFVVASDGVYELSSGKQVVSANGPIWSYWFSPDSRFVAVATSGVYELSSGKQVVSASGVSSAAFSNDSHYVSLIGNGGNDTAYDLTSGQQLISAPRDTGFGTNTAFSPDGSYLSVESDGIYQVTTGKKIIPTGAFYFAADSATVATAIGLFDLASGARIFPETLGKDTTAYAKYSSDGKTAMIMTYEPPARPTDAIITTIFDIPSRKILFQIRTPGEGRVYFDAIFSPDGQSVAVWHDGVYSVPDGKKRFSIDPHGGSSDYTGAPLSFSKDNALLYVSDGAAYDMRTGSVRFAMNGDALGGNQDLMGDMFDVSNDGRLLSDQVGVYDAATGIRLATGRAKFPLSGNRLAVSSTRTTTCNILESGPA